MNEYKDVIRVESTEAGLTGILRNGQLGFATDLKKRLTYKYADGAVSHFTPDAATQEITDLYCDNLIHIDDANTKIAYSPDQVQHSVGGSQFLASLKGDTALQTELDGDFLFINGTQILRTTGAQGEVLYCTSDGIAQFTGLTNLDTLASEKVTYTTTKYPTITNAKEAFDRLFYTAISVSFNVTTADVEKGTTVDVVACQWSYTVLATGQTITSIASQGGSLSAGVTAMSYTGLGLTSDQAFSLIASDGTETGSASDTIRFKLYKYYGQSANITPDEAAVEAYLNGARSFSTDAAASRLLSSVTQAGGSKYVYYAYPKAWGTVHIYVNGFFSVWNKTTVSITNAAANTEDYYVYTSPNEIVGSIALSATA